MDPVAQIFEQAKNVSGGAPFGEFFVQGYQSAQRDRELDQRDVGLGINREQNRIANLSAGLRATEGRAKQFLKLAEQEKDLEFTQAYTAWIAKDAPPEDIPNLMGMVNGTSANHEVVGQFFNRVNGILEVEAKKAEFTDAAKIAKGNNLPLASMTGGGGTFRNPPQSSETIYGPDGKPLIRRTNGQVFEPTTSTETNLQASVGASLRVVQNASMLAALSTDETIGPIGYLNRFFERVGAKTPGAATDIVASQKAFSAELVRALRSDGQINKDEVNRLIKDIGLDFIDSPERYARAVSRTGRLLVESNKQSLVAAGMQIPLQMQAENLPTNMLTQDELLVARKTGKLSHLSDSALRKLWRSAPFQANESFPLATPALNIP